MSRSVGVWVAAAPVGLCFVARAVSVEVQIRLFTGPQRGASPSAFVEREIQQST